MTNHQLEFSDDALAPINVQRISVEGGEKLHFLGAPNKREAPTFDSSHPLFVDEACKAALVLADPIGQVSGRFWRINGKNKTTKPSACELAYELEFETAFA